MPPSLQAARTDPGVRQPPPQRGAVVNAGSGAGLRLVDAPPQPVQVNRLMACMAGFFREEAEALAAAQQLTQVHGLQRSQWVVLGPSDASPQRFERGARLWAGRWQGNTRSPRGDHWLRAGVGLLLGGLLAVAWWLPDWNPADDLYWPSLAVAPLAGAGLVALGGALWRKGPRPRRFDQRVREQLAAGAWAVVTCGVPWQRQAGVIALLRASSLKWCGEATPTPRL